MQVQSSRIAALSASQNSLVSARPSLSQVVDAGPCMQHMAAEACVRNKQHQDAALQDVARSPAMHARLVDFGSQSLGQVPSVSLCYNPTAAGALWEAVACRAGIVNRALRGTICSTEEAATTVIRPQRHSRLLHCWRSLVSEALLLLLRPVVRLGALVPRVLDHLVAIRHPP